MGLSSRIRRAREIAALLGNTAIKWLLNADFSDTQAAPIPRTAEPTGALKVTDTGARASIVGGKLTINLSVGVNWGEPGFWDNTARTRTAGLMVIGALKHLTATKKSMIGFAANQASTIDENSIHRDSAGTYAARFGGASLTLSNTFVADVEYTEAVILRSGGAFYLVKGGAYTNWTLLFITSLQNTATLYPAYSPGDRTANSQELDYLRCRQLPAPFSSDFGLATLHQTSPVAGTEYEGEADGIFDFTFTLPADWGAGDVIAMYYRYVDASNTWFVSLSNSGILYLFSKVSGTDTERLAVGGVFSAGQTYTIRIITQGSKHNAYTLNGTTWTKRGAEVNVVTAMDAEKTMRLYVAGTHAPTFSALDAWPRTLSAALAAELDRVEDVTWLLRDDFTTAAAAGQIVRRPAVPGPGTLTFKQASSVWSIASGALTPNAAGLAFPNQMMLETAGRTRAAGLMLWARIMRVSAYGAPNNGWALGWSPSATPSSFSSVSLVYSMPELASHNGAYNPIPGPDVPDVYYSWVIILRTSGFTAIQDGKIMWVEPIVNTSPVYPMLATVNSNSQPPAADYFRVRQLPAPFNTDYGLATWTTTTFTQSLGPELLTNGDFSAWTGDNPDGWTVGGEAGSDPMVTQVAPGGGAGTGAARFYASTATPNPNLTQVKLTTTAIHELYVTVSARVSGTVQWNDNWAGGFSITDQSTVSTRHALARPKGTTLLLLTSSDAHDIVVDQVSAKALSLNAVQTATADGIFDFEFTVPVSPIQGQSIHLLYRIEAAGDEMYDCWDAYLERYASDWTFKLDSISAGTRTNRISVTGITGSPDTIRVICEGSLHDCYTKTGTTWTKRGSQVSVSHLNTSTLINTVYSSAATAGRLTAWPRTLSAGLGAELEKV